eukprot:comp7454_c0_seq1/m.3125 comp7454_c0_seq1/g.3125  ORF comp7454_c0_seq1/g.3125 comp7454_c0_seq1/m.3125 type:complete len:165 (-) comp7454_c0_seq1:281-775(-)
MAPRAHMVVAVFGFVVAVAWIKLLSTELVALLTGLGVVSGVSSDLMGMTVLAWANCVMDYMADVAMARSGFPQMAVGAVFGGPLLNLLMGMGAACTMATLSGPFPLHVTLRLQVVACFLAASLLVSVIAVPISGFRVGRVQGLLLLGLYGAYLGAIVAMLAMGW